MRRTFALLALLALAAVPACKGSDASAPSLTVAGSWVGTIGSQTITMTLVENAGAVSGSGTITNTPTGTRALTIAGTFAAAKLNVTMSSGTTQPFHFDAPVVLPRSMTGRLTGSGFTGDVIIFDRR